MLGGDDAKGITKGHSTYDVDHCFITTTLDLSAASIFDLKATPTLIENSVSEWNVNHTV